MKCEECGRDGVFRIKKLALVIGFALRCSECGAEYQYHNGLLVFLSVLVQVLISLSIIYAFGHLSVERLLIGLSIGTILIVFIVLVLPIRKLEKFRITK